MSSVIRTTGSSCPSRVGGGNELKFLKTAAAFISASRYLTVVSWSTHSSQCRVARRHDICFQSVTECDADTCENPCGSCFFESVMKCDADICKNLQVNLVFPGVTIDFLTVARTISMPQIGGLVQRREVTVVGLESRLDTDGLIVPSMTDCWMRHLQRSLYTGHARSGWRVLANLWTLVLTKCSTGVDGLLVISSCRWWCYLCLHYRYGKCELPKLLSIKS